MDEQPAKSYSHTSLPSQVRKRQREDTEKEVGMLGEGAMEYHPEWSNMYAHIESNSDRLEQIVYDTFLENPIIAQSDGENKTRLLKFIKEILGYYNDVAYHNAKHAVHVMLSIHYLWKYHTGAYTLGDLEGLAILFSALIHDVEHTGKSNALLVEEGHALARLYNDRCCVLVVLKYS